MVEKKTVEIEVTVEGADTANEKLEKLSGKAKQLKDNLGGLGGEIDVAGMKPPTPSKKPTPDTDPHLKMLGLIHGTLKQILANMSGGTGSTKITRQGAEPQKAKTPYVREVKEDTSAQKEKMKTFLEKGVIEPLQEIRKPVQKKPPEMLPWFSEAREYMDKNSPYKVPRQSKGWSEHDPSYDYEDFGKETNPVESFKAKISEEISKMAAVHQETLMASQKDYLADIKNTGLASKRSRYENYLDRLEKEGVKRKQKDTIDVIKPESRPYIEISNILEKLRPRIPVFERDDVLPGPGESVEEATASNRKKRGIELDAANDWRKGIRGMITGALIDLHVLKIIGQSSKVFGSMMGLLSSHLGYLIDVIVIPLIPGFMALSRVILGVASAFVGLHPLVKTLLAMAAAGAALAVVFLTLNTTFKALTGIDAVQSIFGLLGKLKKRAAGGPLQSGEMAIVGERGPELIIPQGSVDVIPNNQLRFLADGTTAALGSAVAGGLLTSNTDVGSVLGYGAGGAAIGGLIGGTRGAILGGLLGAEIQATGLSESMPGIVGNAASAIYSNEGVQGVLSTFNTVAASINAVLAPMAPILGVGAGLMGAAALSRGKDSGSAETTVRTSTVINKTLQNVGFSIQSAISKAAGGTNIILTLILMKLGDILKSLIPLIPTLKPPAKTPTPKSPTPTSEQEPTKPKSPEPPKPPELPPRPKVPELPKIPKVPVIPAAETWLKLTESIKRIGLKATTAREPLPSTDEKPALGQRQITREIPPTSGIKMLPAGNYKSEFDNSIKRLSVGVDEFTKSLPRGDDVLDRMFRGADSGDLSPSKFMKNMYDRVSGLFVNEYKNWYSPEGQKLDRSGYPIEKRSIGMKNLGKAMGAGAGIGAGIGAIEGIVYGEPIEDILKNALGGAAVGASTANPVGAALATLSMLAYPAGGGTNIGPSSWNKNNIPYVYNPEEPVPYNKDWSVKQTPVKQENITNTYNVNITSSAQNADQLYLEFARRLKQDTQRLI